MTIERKVNTSLQILLALKLLFRLGETIHILER